MKIIGVDNYARDEVSDVLVCENINESYGTEIVDFLNRHENNPRFYKLEDDDYKLYIFGY